MLVFWSVLGRPTSSGRYADAGGGGPAFYAYGDKRHTYIEFDTNRRVVRVSTTQTGPRTAEGVGVGSSEKDVDALSQTACRVERVDDAERGLYYRHECYRLTPSAKMTYELPDTEGHAPDRDAQRVQRVTLERR